MEQEQVTLSTYKELICDMIQQMNDIRFIKQIYSIVFRQAKRTGS
jgi:hypothetical protein